MTACIVRMILTTVNHSHVIMVVSASMESTGIDVTVQQVLLGLTVELT